MIQVTDHTGDCPERNDSADDLLTVRGALLGDDACVKKLMGRMGCVPRILNGLNRRMGRPLDDHEVADSVQDTLIVIWNKLGQFQGAGALEFWAYRIAYLEFMNAIRRHRRRPQPQANFNVVIDPAAQPESSVDLEDERDRVERGLTRLGPPESDVIRMKHYDGMTFVEIGAATHVSVNTIKAQYYRGIDQLRVLVRPRMKVEAR